jgi:hypothetical protein
MLVRFGGTVVATGPLIAFPRRFTRRVPDPVEIPEIHFWPGI